MKAEKCRAVTRLADFSQLLITANYFSVCSVGHHLRKSRDFIYLLVPGRSRAAKAPSPRPEWLYIGSDRTLSQYTHIPTTKCQDQALSRSGIAREVSNNNHNAKDFSPSTKNQR